MRDEGFEKRFSSFRLPRSSFPKSAGFPLASAASRPATETQGPTAQRFKNSQRDVE
jgi:hypothetical protein